MAKATSPTPQRTPAAKKSSSTTTVSSRSRKSPVPPAPASAEPGPDSLLLLTQRLDTLEEKMTSGLSTLIAEVRALTAAGSTRSGDSPPSDTFLPVVADLIRRSLTEHVTPLTAALKRLEERMGFISNRLKHPASGPPERQKPWRHDQQRHDQQRHDQSRHPRPRLHTAPRPGPQGQGGQPWTPPSAASVQGHFAPRPPFGGEDRQPQQDEEE